MLSDKKKYSGVVVPMVSPLHDGQAVDKEAVKILTDSVVGAGAVPFVLGSTGEGYSLSTDQKLDIVQSTVVTVSKRCHIYAGISSISFSTALKEAELFAENGVDVLVATLPFFYPVDDKQMLAFFISLADKLPLPLMLYNMPAMVKRPIPLEVADILSKHGNIIGLKDSERDEQRLKESIRLWSHREDFSFYIGWAAMSFMGLSLGADGIVPSTGNLCPELYCSLMDAVGGNNMKLAKELQLLTNKISLLYQEGKDLSHSIPALKLMLSVQGKCNKTVAPPMCEMQKEEEEIYLDNVVPKMKEFGCL